MEMLKHICGKLENMESKLETVEGELHTVKGELHVRKLCCLTRTRSLSVPLLTCGTYIA
jgi:hypothetical protein